MYLWWAAWQRTSCSSMCKHALHLCAVVRHAGLQPPSVPSSAQAQERHTAAVGLTHPLPELAPFMASGMDSEPSKSGVTLLLQFLKDFIFTCGQVLWFLWVIKEMFTYWGYATIILAYTWVTLNIMLVCGLLKIHCTSALILRKGTLTRSKICPC